MEEDKMRVLIVEPMKPPKEKKIAHDLETMQNIVGGIIQAVYSFSDNVAVVCNDESKLMGLLPNRFLRDERTGQPYDILCGTFFVTGVRGDEFCSLTDAQIKKYSAMYDKERMFTVPERKTEKAKER